MKRKKRKVEEPRKQPKLRCRKIRKMEFLFLSLTSGYDFSLAAKHHT